MNKKIFAGIAALLVLGLAGGGYFWWVKSRQIPPPAAATQAVTDIQDTVDTVNQRVAQDLYSNTDTVVIPDVNPYRNTNPFSDIKTNPFK